MSIKETDLYWKIENTGPFANQSFHYEVPIGPWSESRKQIDMVVINNSKITAIEVKISSWRKALQQAYANLWVFDYSYVAMWHKAIPNMDMTLFRELGIGVLEVNDTCKEILQAKQSNAIIAKTKNYAKNYCKSK